ncbi:MAG: GNAT family N-acetyltransferase [Terracidiphilus sp.]|nr:GNAT family N-acetyltransferase [Terracidiphilus sp.]
MPNADHIHYRFATAADVPALVPMINAAFTVEFFLDATRTDTSRLAAQMQKGRILVAEDDANQLLASIYIESRDDRAYLGMFAVAPEHQGSGLGRLLFQAAEEQLRSEGFRHLEISVLNLRPELLPIYRRFGFAETGTEPYRSPQHVKEGYSCHCIVMAKQL